MKNAFGIQRVIPVVEPPKGTTILSLNFSPNPTPAVQENLKQQTTEVDQPKVELQTKKEDNTKDDGENEEAKELAKNIQDAIARGDIKVEALGNKVVVNFTPTKADEKELPELLQETLNAVESVKAASGKSDSEVLIGGLEKQLADLATASSQKGKSEAEGNDGDNVGQSSESQSAKDEAKKAELAEDKLKVALKEEIGEGLVNVDREDDKVVITVGSAGAFKSGSAELTKKAREIMAKIADQNKKGRSEILVMGHTDNVPLTFGSNFRDNWDLAAARSASVVQQLSKNDSLDPRRMKAISYGETRPLESNDTTKGRAKNRRIEIEINY
jgi:chemotaxis protein MotB